MQKENFVAKNKDWLCLGVKLLVNVSEYLRCMFMIANVCMYNLMCNRRVL